jgi:hypothetical protein
MFTARTTVFGFLAGCHWRMMLRRRKEREHAPGRRRSSSMSAPLRPGGAIGGLAALALLLVFVAGCGGSSTKHSAAAKAVACGMARTAANVPVHVEVTQGHVGCGTALSIEKKYAQAIRSGLAPGNGGGGPVKVNGWTCEGYSTPVVLRTGKASRCVDGSNEILAILATTT